MLRRLLGPLRLRVAAPAALPSTFNGASVPLARLPVMAKVPAITVVAPV